MRSIGILFDMDGVLVDSEPVITAAACEALAHFGIPAKHDDFKPFTGMGEIRFLGGVAEKYGATYRPEMKELTYKIYGELVDANLRVYQKTLDTLKELKAAGYPLALASSADLVKVMHNLRVAKIPGDTFAAIVTAEDVARKKPFPDIFLAAAEKIGMAAEDCVVVEDAVSGVQAGVAAGARVIAVTTSFDGEALREVGASMVVEDIGGVPQALESIFKGL